METRLGSPVELFAYPNGRDIDYNEGSIELLRNISYCSAVAAVPGFNIPDYGPFRLRRVPVGIMGQQFPFPL